MRGAIAGEKAPARRRERLSTRDQRLRIHDGVFVTAFFRLGNKSQIICQKGLQIEALRIADAPV